MTEPIAEPKCPSCGVVGMGYIASKDSLVTSRAGDPWFNIAYCGNCGHVYGVFAKVANPPSRG